ncbi:MAG: PTS sugar transporter subunit IIA [Acidobacteriota bacterium]
MQLDTLTRPALILPDLKASDRATVLRLLAEGIVDAGALDDANALYRKLDERESLGSTGIGGGVAIPHCKVDGLDDVVLAVGMTRNRDVGVDFDAVDGQPVHLFFVIVSPAKAPAAHLQCLAAISKWVKTPGNVDAVLALDEPDAIYARLQASFAESS